MDNKKAHGASVGTDGNGKNDGKSFKGNCNTFHSPLSTLLDQALHRFEHYSSLSRIYAAEAEKHKAILSSLQSLIPPGKRGKGGAA